MSPLPGTDQNTPEFLKMLEDWNKANGITTPTRTDSFGGTYENDPTKEMFPADWYTNPSAYAGVDPSIYNRQTTGGNTMSGSAVQQPTSFDFSNLYNASQPLQSGGGSVSLRDYNQFMQKNRTGPNSRLSYNDFAANPSAYTSPLGGGGAGAGGVAGGGGILNRSGSVPYGDLAEHINAFMTEQARMPFVSNLPGYEAMLGSASRNTQDQLSGQVSQGTTNTIAQAGAERGIATGGPASPNNNAAYLRALGLTSEGLQQQGQANLHQLIADTPTPELFNPASIFVPEYLAQLELAAQKQGQRNAPTVGSGGGGGYNQFGTQTSKPSYLTTDPRFKQQQPSNFGFTPNSASNGWGLPPVAPGYSYNDYAQPGGAPDYSDERQYYQPGGSGFGDWSSLNASDYQTNGTDWGSDYFGTGVPQYDYGQMYSDAGADFTDWSLADVDWSVYE